MDIQLIINTEVDMVQMWREQEDGLFPHRPAEVNEMEDGTYLIVIEYKDQYDAIETSIEEQGDVDVISSHNQDGTLYEWDNSNRNHTIQKYRGRLKPHPVWNETTEEFEDVAYTETEAKDVQVNHVAGWLPRQL